MYMSNNKFIKHKCNTCYKYITWNKSKIQMYIYEKGRRNESITLHDSV